MQTEITKTSGDIVADAALTIVKAAYTPENQRYLAKIFINQQNFAAKILDEFNLDNLEKYLEKKRQETINNNYDKAKKDREGLFVRVICITIAIALCAIILKKISSYAGATGNIGTMESITYIFDNFLPKFVRLKMSRILKKISEEKDVSKQTIYDIVNKEFQANSKREIEELLEKFENGSKINKENSPTKNTDLKKIKVESSPKTEIKSADINPLKTNKDKPSKVNKEPLEENLHKPDKGNNSSIHTKENNTTKTDKKESAEKIPATKEESSQDEHSLNKSWLERLNKYLEKFLNSVKEEKTQKKNTPNIQAPTDFEPKNEHDFEIIGGNFINQNDGRVAYGNGNGEVAFAAKFVGEENNLKEIKEERLNNEDREYLEFINSIKTFQNGFIVTKGGKLQTESDKNESDNFSRFVLKGLIETVKNRSNVRMGKEKYIHEII